MFDWLCCSRASSSAKKHETLGKWGFVLGRDGTTTLEIPLGPSLILLLVSSVAIMCVRVCERMQQTLFYASCGFALALSPYRVDSGQRWRCTGPAFGLT